MTGLVEDRRPPSAPAQGGRPGAHAQGGRAGCITGATTWTDNIQLPGMLHIGDRAQPGRARPDHPRRRRRAALAGPAWSPPSAAATSPTSRAPCPAPGRSTADMVNPGHPSLAVDEVRHVGEAVAVVVARDRYRGRGRGRGRRGRLRRRCRPSSTWRRRSPDGADLVPRRQRHQQVLHLVFDAGERHGRGHRPGSPRPTSSSSGGTSSSG